MIAARMIAMAMVQQPVMSAPLTRQAPVIEYSDEYASAASATTTHNIPIGSPEVGALIIITVTLAGTSSLESATHPAGWTTIYNAPTGSTNRRGLMLARIADGTEGSNATISTNSNARATATVIHVSRYDVDLSEGDGYDVATQPHSETSFPDPPPLTPSFGEEPALWLAASHIYRGQRPTPTAPSGFGATLHASNPGGFEGSQGTVTTATRSQSVETDNPGSFDYSADYAHGGGSALAATVAIRGGFS